jgi:hypothetical protein
MKDQLEFWCDVLGCPLRALYYMHGVDGAFHGFVELAPESYIAFVQHPHPGDADQPFEIFRPIVTIASFDGESDAIRLANDSRYGLNAMVFTENARRAHRVARAVRAGNQLLPRSRPARTVRRLHGQRDRP